MPETLEPADIRILRALQAEGRLTNQALAETVGLSASPCWRRVRALEETAVIQRLRAVLDRRKVGLGVLAFARVRVGGHSDKEAEEFAASVARLERGRRLLRHRRRRRLPAPGGRRRPRRLCPLLHGGAAGAAAHQGDADDVRAEGDQALSGPAGRRRGLSGARQGHACEKPRGGCRGAFAKYGDGLSGASDGRAGRGPSRRAGRSRSTSRRHRPS